MTTLTPILHSSIIVIAFAFWVYLLAKEIVIPVVQALFGNAQSIQKLTLFRCLLIIVSGILLTVSAQNIRPTPIDSPNTIPVVHNVSDVEDQPLPPKKEVITLSTSEILAQKVAENAASNSNSIKRISVLNAK